MTPNPRRGDIVEVFWSPPAVTKRARFVRWNRTGTATVEVERVDVKGVWTGDWGKGRSVASTDILRVLEVAS